MDEEKCPWRILLVDDEEAITAQLAPFLERASSTVEVAGDGEEALRRVAEFTPDVIVLDVLLAGCATPTPQIAPTPTPQHVPVQPTQTTAPTDTPAPSPTPTIS